MRTGSIDLILDVGNSRTKLALFGALGMVRNSIADNGDLAAIKAFVEGEQIGAVALGSVAKPDHTLLDGLSRIAKVLVLNGASASPVKNAYGTPLTLGADRLANVTAAVQRFPSRPVLVIDPGSCITYDVCEADGTYAGGAISPGMHMRGKAMNAYSARLPLVTPEAIPAALGDTTEASLGSGIHHGIVGEMREFIRLYGTARPDLAVLMTGGDALRFANALESGIFALPFLTLEGYHALLDHHRSLHGGVIAPGS